MIKTAVIGASGYIGRHLLTKYREQFPDCIGTSFSKTHEGLTPFDLRAPDITKLNLEATGHQAVLIASAKPLIAYCENNKTESYELNVKGTLELVRQLGKTAITTIFYSSDYVFDGKTGQYSDAAEVSPTTEYGRQKAEVEREIPNITDNYMILRLSKIYGTTYKDGTLIDLLAADFMSGKKSMVASDQFFSPTHVDDVVAMTVHAQAQKARGLFNLCHANRCSRFQIATQLAKLLGVPSSLIEEISLYSIPAMVGRPLDTSLIRSTIFDNLQAISVDDAIQTIASQWTKSALTSAAS